MVVVNGVARLFVCLFGVFFFFFFFSLFGLLIVCFADKREAIHDLQNISSQNVRIVRIQKHKPS